ncbi:MAG: MATE family efflux transporter [Paludibacteraceae bacterium]|nr:MATE family efflux transporter [Paludibacteraceae bacterium]
MLTSLGAALVGFFDSIMVGHYGTADLAAVSFSNAIFFTVMVFAMGAMMGLTPLVGHEVGRIEKVLANANANANANAQEYIAQKQQRIAALFANGAVFMVLLSVLSLVLLVPCIPYLDAFGQEPEVVACARPYYILIVLSIIPFMLFCLFKQFLEGLGNTAVAMVITLGCNLLNIGLNWVFIFGHWGVPAMGAAGAGLATLIARILMPVCFLIAMLYRDEWRHLLRLIRRWMISRREIENLLYIGTPIGLQTFVEAFLFTASFIIIGWISKEALAAHHIANQMADMTFMIAQGIGAATTIRVSHQLGKGDLHAVRMASRASIHLCLLMNTIGAAIMIGFRHQIPFIFTEDLQVVPIASTLLLFGGLFQYADGMQCIGASMLRGIQDVRVPMRIAVFSYIGIALPLGIYLTFYAPHPSIFNCQLSTSSGYGAAGMWAAFVIALAIPAVLFHIRFHRQMKRLEESHSAPI